MTDSRGLSWRQWQDPEVFIVCGFGSGFAPRAPGTSGSALAVLLWWWLLAPLSPGFQLTVIVVVVLLGTWLVSRVQRRHKVNDPGAIVIDEFAGQWLVLLLAPAEPLVVLGGFLLFRLFDIWKPWPVGWLERRVPGAFGVMVDDLAAGLMGLIVLQFTLWSCHAF
ncbi:MAG: phosphatidylglycerophosphatase A [Pseudomonadales bacterium]